MGTRCEIYIINEDGNVIELWKHWDGYPEYMVPYLIEFREFAEKVVGDQKHWLTYPEDVSALLVAFDYEKHKNNGLGYTRPDIRPRGRINDLEYVYILNVGKTNGSAEWDLKVYKCTKLELTDSERRMIKSGKIPKKLIHMKRWSVSFKVACKLQQ